MRAFEFDVLKNILSLIFFMLSYNLSANTYIIILFDQNLFKEKEFVIYSNDKGFALNADSLNNCFFLAVFDFSYRSRIFWGPTKISYENRSLYFDFDEDILFTFNHLKGFNDDIFFDDTTLAKISLVNDLKNLNNVIYGVLHLNNNKKNYFFSPFIYKQSDILKIYFDIKNHFEAKNFDSLKIIFERLHKMYPNNKDLYQFYILSLLDCAEFHEANAYLDSYNLKFDDDTFYYSLKGNIQAIWGNLEKAKKIFEKGRKKYPESFTLLNDILNIYSITDSLKFEDYNNYLDLKFKR